MESEARTPLMRGLAAAGWQIESDESEGGAAAAAAYFAGRSSLELIPQSLAVERQQRQRRRALQFAALAALFVIGAGAIELWGARRELATIRARRAEIRQDVTPLLAVRDSLNTLEQRLTQIGGLQAAAPHWTSALFDLAMLLPADAYLRSLRASGDTLVIEASGSRAGETIQALRSAPTLRDVQLRGQVERLLEDGSTAVERFTLQARLAGSAASSSDSTSATRPERARPMPGRSR
jgi:Tfp pilus assembly protein PilN